MELDIRLIIGLLFNVLGLLLAAFGAISQKGIYQRSLDINVNLGWGIVLFLFGVVMIVLGKRSEAARKRRSSDASFENEQRSHNG